MNDTEIKQQIIENLEIMLEKAKTGGAVRFIGALRVDGKVTTAVTGALLDVTALLLSFSVEDEDIARAMSVAAKIAKEKAKRDK